MVITNKLELLMNNEGIHCSTIYENLPFSYFSTRKWARWSNSIEISLSDSLIGLAKRKIIEFTKLSLFRLDESKQGDTLSASIGTLNNSIGKVIKNGFWQTRQETPTSNNYIKFFLVVFVSFHSNFHWCTLLLNS